MPGYVATAANQLVSRSAFSLSNALPTVGYSRYVAIKSRLTIYCDSVERTNQAPGCRTRGSIRHRQGFPLKAFLPPFALDALCVHFHSALERSGEGWRRQLRKGQGLV